MRWIIFLVGLLVAVPAAAQPKLLQAHASGSPPTYTGPGDVVSGATAWYGLRGYSAAYAATGTGKSLNVRRASDNATQDIVILTTGAFDIASYNTFVGTDATASCTIAGTAVACTGASATLHVSDLITGVGITQPCRVTVTNGSTTATAVSAGTASTSCGTVSVAETVTFQVAGFAATAYDQAGSSNATQATAGSQPQVLPSAINSLPGLLFNSASTQSLSGTITSSTFTTASEVFVAIRTSAFSNYGGVTNLSGNGTQAAVIGFNVTANNAFMYTGATPITKAATDSVAHAIQGVFNGASSIITVDGSNTTAVNPGAIVTGQTTVSWGDTANYPTGISGEMGVWGNTVFTLTQIANEHTNMAAYWGTP